jgi:hypothetical protein
VLHIRPWEQRELLTVPELRAAIAFVKERIKQQSKGVTRG